MRVQAQDLRRVVSAVFEAAGCSEEEAGAIADDLVTANLLGHDSHGVIRTLRYLNALKAGYVMPGGELETVLDGGAFAIVDGHHGFGQTVGPAACRLGIEKARAHGVAVIGLRRAGHLGRIGRFAEMAAEADQVSIHFVNVAASTLVAPYGAIDRRMGTNPISIGVPVTDRPPLILDFATSVVAEGKAKVALNGGKPVPDNALVGPDGVVTGDTTVLYGEVPEGKNPDPRRGPGALRAMGEQKGSALALACEILAGVLTGSDTSGDTRFCNGMLSIYLSPDHFAVPAFARQAAEFADHVRSAAPADPDQPVQIPGDIERARADEQRANGIDLAEGTWHDLTVTAEKVGVTMPAV